MTPRVREILSWYGADNPGTLTNLARLMNHGRLGGTGKLVILPVDQGFEHGPARSFAKNPGGAMIHLTTFNLRDRVWLQRLRGRRWALSKRVLVIMRARFRSFSRLITQILFYNPTAPISALTSNIDDALSVGLRGHWFHDLPWLAGAKDDVRRDRSCGL